MTTWREAVAAKNERLRREGRFYTPDTLGAKCIDPMCRTALPLALTDVGINAHPTCGPGARSLMQREAAS